MRPVLVLAGWLLAGPLLAASPCESGPPAAAGDAVLLLDFDGDGRQDRVWFLPAGALPDVRGRAADPWRRVQRSLDPNSALLVVDMGAGQRRLRADPELCPMTCSSARCSAIWRS